MSRGGPRDPFAPRHCHRAKPLTRCLLSALFAACLAVLLGGCERPETTQQQATRLAQEMLIVDTHIDAPYRHYRNPADLGGDAPDREFDYPRAVRGGLDVAFMSIYTPAAAAAAGESRALADRLIDQMEALASDQPDRFALATCTADVAALRGSGRVALALGLENGSPLSEPASATAEAPKSATASVAHFVRRGIRYVTLTHSVDNAYADSSYDIRGRWQGLSPAGKALITTLNDHGVMIDISHLSDAAAWQAIELSEAPVIASHSSLRHFVPGFERNMSDEMLAALAAKGGVIQINFGSGFVSAPARAWANERQTAYRERFAEPPAGDTAEREAFMRDYAAEQPYPFATVDTVIDHIDHAIAVAGIDHVGLGSDFDGVGDTLPTGLKDVADFPNLVQGIIERGYQEAAIAKVLSANLMRVWRAVEAYGEAAGQPPICAV